MKKDFGPTRVKIDILCQNRKEFEFACDLLKKWKNFKEKKIKRISMKDGKIKIRLPGKAPTGGVSLN